MKKSTAFFLVVLLAVLAALAFYLFMDKDIEEVQEDENSEEIQGQEDAGLPTAEFIQCLADSGMVVYASKTCPACNALAETFGGYDAVENLFVFCNDEWEKCEEDMKTTFVPEVQYNGEVFEDGRSMEAFAQLTECEL